MELFAKIFHSSKSLTTFALYSFLDVWQGSENASGTLQHLETVNTKAKELKQELLYVIIMSRARFRVSLHSVFAIQKYFGIQKFFRGHSKITSPRKCQILDLSSFYVAVSHFFHYTSSPCHQANSDKLFPWSKTLNRSTN